MLFSYENRKKLVINFSSSRLRRIKVSDLISGWVQYRARRETGDSRSVTSIQECLISWFLYSTVHSEYSTIAFVHSFLPLYTKNNWGDDKNYDAWKSQPS